MGIKGELEEMLAGVFTVGTALASELSAKLLLWQVSSTVPSTSPKGVLDDGRKVTTELFRSLLADELPKVKTYLGEEAWKAGKYEAGAKLFDTLTTGDYVEFLTLPAYDLID